MGSRGPQPGTGGRPRIRPDGAQELTLWLPPAEAEWLRAFAVIRNSHSAVIAREVLIYGIRELAEEQEKKAAVDERLPFESDPDPTSPANTA